MAQLEAAGVVVPAEEASESAPEGGREAAIREAIAALDPDRGEEWMKAGRPDLAVLRSRSGLADLSAQERDAVWKAIQQEGAGE